MRKVSDILNYGLHDTEETAIVYILEVEWVNFWGGLMLAHLTASQVRILHLPRLRQTCQFLGEQLMKKSSVCDCKEI
jgi:hypothetical protein